MSWSCPYFSNDGGCTLRNKGCEPLAKGCVMNASGLYARKKPAAEPIRLDLPGADVLLYRDFFDEMASEHFFNKLTKHIGWEKKKIKIYGRSVAMPRLTAWYGDEGLTYRYSGLTNLPSGWTPDLLAIKRKIEAVSGITFNSVLLNLYRDENDSVGWHSDDEPELGYNPVIGSVSFGQTRRFEWRHRQDKTLRASVELTSGSYLLMKGLTQRHWSHRVPKERFTCQPRINLTFRTIF